MARIKNRLIVRIIYLFVIAAFFSPHAVLAESHIISEISDNMVIAVKDSNIHYELSDIYIEGNVATKAREKINTVASGKEFSFNNISQFPGRHGNFYATIQPASEISLQQILLENGLANVYFLDEAINPTILFSSEAKAEKARLGIWEDGNFKVRNSTEIVNNYKNDLGKFIIVSGVVDNIYTSKKDTYINFGKDWHTDFSVQIENKLLKKQPEFSVEKVTGKKISVRGWLEYYNGPFMKIYNIANIQIIYGK